MFKPLEKTEAEKSTGSGRDMRYIWALVVVRAAVLVTAALVV